MSSSTQAILEAKLFDQVWSSADLNPDRLTNEINKLFTYNKTETERHNFSDIYFDYNKDQITSSSISAGGGISIPLLGIGIGGTAEKAAVLAKESLMDPIDIHELRERGPANRVEELRLEIMEKVNKLGIWWTSTITW